MKHGTLAAAVAALTMTTAAVAAQEPAGDPEFGQFVFEESCALCHQIDTNLPTGPAVGGIVGTKAGTRDGYAFSPAMLGSDVVWTADTLDAFMIDPLAMFPGSTAGPCRLDDAEARTDVIAYLYSLQG